MEQFDPISVPPDWRVEQDLAFYEERWAEDAPDYAEGLRNAMLFHCAGLVRVIDAALRYFYSRNLTLFPFPPECLSVSEKLDILQSIVNKNPRDDCYHERLQADIRLCRWAEAERSRI